MWVNAAGEKFWVKYHFKTDQGVENFTGPEAAEVAASDLDYHRRDLFTAIKAGRHPSWTLHVQVMPFADAPDYRFNPFDLTKVWPHGDYPLIKVGTLRLNRNPENFFAQIEQAAFEPSALVPGIGISPDKMLLGRMFAYSDTHRHRIGPNYLQLPVNQPKVPVDTYSFDGAMRYHHTGNQPVYAPNSFGGPLADPAQGEDYGWHSDGEMVRAANSLHSQDDDFGQPGTLVREVLDDAARQRLVDNVVTALSDGVTQPVLGRALEYWRNVDKDLGDKIAASL
ncbi:MAG: catalase, partial [Stackebrandtia sp.]